jgi:hypothetical protein
LLCPRLLAGLRAALLDLLPGGEEKIQVVILVLLPAPLKHGRGDGRGGESGRNSGRGVETGPKFVNEFVPQR